MPNLLAVGKLLFQLGDFAVKAIVHYADTDEGEKEWGDVVAAFVELDLFNPADAAQGVSVTPNDGGDKLTLADIQRLSETFNKAEGEQGTRGVPAPPRRVIRHGQPPNVDDIPF